MLYCVLYIVYCIILYSSPMDLFLFYIPLKRQGEACKDNIEDSGKTPRSFCHFEIVSKNQHMEPRFPVNGDVQKPTN